MLNPPCTWEGWCWGWWAAWWSSQRVERWRDAIYGNGLPLGFQGRRFLAVVLSRRTLYTISEDWVSELFFLPCRANETCLIFVNIVRQFSLAKLIECDDDESDKDVDKEEWKDNKVNNVVDRHFRSEPRDRTLVLKRRRHWVLQHPGEKRKYKLQQKKQRKTYAIHPSEVCTAKRVIMAMAQLS